MAKEWLISAIAQIVGGELETHAPESSTIQHLATDSRRIAAGATTLFFALQGPRRDGSQFIQQAFDQGVRNFVLPSKANNSGLEANFIFVPDTTLALQSLATWHRQQFQLPVIGITGSNGKTIIKEWLYQLLADDYAIARTPASYNSQIGVPLSVWPLSEEHQLGIFEAGISRKGEMAKLSTIIHCDIGLLTNIGAAHDEGFSSRQEKLEEKLELFRFAGIILYCRDDERIDQSIRALNKPFFCWSRQKEADLHIQSERTEGKHYLLKLLYQGSELELSLPFSDPISVENALHCLALLLYMGYTPANAAAKIMLLRPLAMRQEILQGINECTLINDSYSLDLTALTLSLTALKRQDNSSRKSLILSDILQSGLPPEILYQKVADLVRQAGIQRFLGIGKDIPLIKAHLPADMETHFFPSTDAFLQWEKHDFFSKETLLIKGARRFEFERIVRRLSQKIHQTTLEVNLDALWQNIQIHQSYLNPNTKLMLMVKANAYGCGSLEVARMLSFHQIDYLAVAYADEGIELRTGGIPLPVVVLHPEEAVFDGLLRYNLEPEIFNTKLLVAYAEASKNLGRVVPIHIKIDTGMRRLGFEPTELDSLIELLKKYPHLEVRSLFSHLAASEDPTQDEFSEQQVQIFQATAKALCHALAIQPLRHILNSAGILRFPQYQMDMVRLGIGAYGVDSSQLIPERLQPVLQLKARIAQIKHLKEAATIGYGRKGQKAAGGKIATISIGYADGLPRRAGNGRWHLEVRGQRVPIIGNVCMDMCMLDVSEVKDVQEGDEVCIFGESPTVSDMAKALDTIPYEIWTGISKRVHRVYWR